VRAGNNYERHTARWTGFQNWWRSLFGVRVASAPGAVAREGERLANTPRVGKKNIDVMVHDFLNAWLVEGDVMAATACVSQRAYACLAQEGDDPATLDRAWRPSSC
jgi:hypothetical protein